MTRGVSNLLLGKFSEFVAVHMGLQFPPERWPDLDRGIRKAMPEFGFADEEECVNWLMSAPLTRKQIEILADDLTVGETYFFRDPRIFEILAAQIVPQIIQSRRGSGQHLRFWSAACCTGEEAYSLAIALRRAIPDLASWQVTILGTDINPRFLRKAVAGVFGEWSFRGVPEWLKQTYFKPIAQGQYQILPEIRRMVRFEHLNLAKDTYPSLLTDTNAMDVILCRNVLMYFSPSRVRQVFRQLHRCLVDSGWLALSASEMPFAANDEFECVAFGDAVLLRKASCAEPPTVMPFVPLTKDVEKKGSSAKAAPKTEAAGVDNAQQMIRSAREAANQGRLSEALVLVDRLLRIEKMNPIAHYLRAMILQEQGIILEAAKALRHAVYLDPGFVLAHFALGALNCNAGRPRQAEKHFANAVQLLKPFCRSDILPESEGITAGRLEETIGLMCERMGTR